MKDRINSILKEFVNDPTRLMNILHKVQDSFGYIPDEAVSQIAAGLNMSEVDIEQTISFYHFFLRKPAGRYMIYLNDSVMSRMHGYEEVRKAFEENLGTPIGSISQDGIGFYRTACIGMSDQEPAALINNKVFTNLTVEKVEQIVAGMKGGREVEHLLNLGYGDGNNSHPLIRSMVNNNIRKSGKLLDDFYEPGTALEIALNKSEWEVIGIVKTSGIRGRGGAGFPTGMKWEFCRLSPGHPKYVFCNADEGEPGTFKDRVLLTEKAKVMFEGMTIAGYAIGAKEGILYLRYEYKYLVEYLESILKELRESNRLGNNILGKEGFNFDIRIQLGAGAYICGEESALIESAEGKRGEPRYKPPFPVEAGFKGKPTSVNNVETFCSICRIIERGGEWFRSLGTSASTGTKLLSISGDCPRPGVYEVEWGITVEEMLNMVGAVNVQAIQIGGPSGTLISPEDGEFQPICYNHLATGGAIMIFDKTRNLLKDVVRPFMDFFIDESCGSCSTCRITSQQLAGKLDKILSGHGVARDLDDLESWSKIMLASRCGLGQSAANPITTSLKNFRNLFEDLIRKDTDCDTGFDLSQAVTEYCEATGREPVLD
jgi:[NiFe] hydrogenase diaphorase moiety large subunit